MRVPQLFSQKKQTMRRMLFGYMLVLVLVVSALIFASLFIFGKYSTTKETLSGTLSLQMEVFEREITAHHENLAMRGFQLSNDSSIILQSYFRRNAISFNNLKNSQSHLNALQSEFLELLRDKLLHTECSGAFILLDTTVNTELKNSQSSKSGVYVQRSSVDATDDTLILYRGDSRTAKNKGIMPHRKWKLELDSNIFPSYDTLINITPDRPLEKAYFITEVVTLPGTSEKIMLIALPIRAQDGTVYGICGFELSETTFKTYHAQPSTLQHLVGVFTKAKDDKIDISKSFTCGVSGGYHYSPDGVLKPHKFGKGLYSFNGEKEEYIGITREINICCDNKHKYTLAVMIPKYDYNKMHLEDSLQLILLIAMLIIVAVSCCGYFSKRYISPIIKKLEKLRACAAQEDETDESTYSEIEDLFAFLKSKENELSKAQSRAEKLYYSRKTEIDPDDYEYFKMGIKTLTKSERKVFDLYMSGKTAREIMEIASIKERTIKFHNSNIYDKLGVKNMKELLRFATLYEKENGENI